MRTFAYYADDVKSSRGLQTPRVASLAKGHLSFLGEFG
jgi:hypothetical protein